MDISRRRALGLFAGAAGGAGLTACATNTTTNAADLNYAETSVDVTFDHGVASGDALNDRVILWTRVTPETDTDETIEVVCSWMAGDADLLVDGNVPIGVDTTASKVFRTSKARDFTVKIDADELEPGKVFLYQFAVKVPGGWKVSPIGMTRTLPETGGDKLSVAVVSCSNWPFGYFNVYKAISERGDVDAVLHLGDYIYEYGIDGYGAEYGEKLGRLHMPVTEIVTLDDYRERHAQYKSDANLQAAHAVAPWYCTWDDHESTNNSYRSGAQNHNPENNEGDWTERKQTAVQAYLEWMPVRDPQPGMAKESIYRSANFGDLATLFMLESRLTGRSDEISWFTELADTEPAQIPAKAMSVLGKVNDPSRTLLGQVQEDWLTEGLKTSVENGTKWQLLVNQVIMAKVKLPNLAQELSEEAQAAIPEGFGKTAVQFSQLGLPFNLDAWDGFPAARDRLQASAKSAGARIVTVTGDTHTAWANDLHDKEGSSAGVEFGCTSVTSPGMGTYMPIPQLGELFAKANDDVTWHDPFGNGFTMLTLTPEKARADFYKVSTIEKEEFTTELAVSFEAIAEDDGVSALKKV